ncbi:16S rRNA (guanine(966)-N(2))-methyltransferase RsmD [Pseudoalteromonas sp. A25]|uniref:16S rRNA (guanine(966)-N(2))-methyltransferase RsmD n=1 Tax=Pseudoalteromonas sp. A25 TaxID=116092 RepID=UPI0012610721|nr:16S rRNA (guanine(966)-N(2))-methyltransferase RsmD [Pseudoalteromonas sp. A25]
MRKKKPAKPHQNDGVIRIISGQFKGRKLPVKDVAGLRPTTDRIKETVFNWLMQDTRDATVLDCFAGSGGLGFECLSRFAKSACFIELDNQAAQQLHSNINTLKLSNARVLNSNSINVLTNNTDGLTFDLVFVDPPFRQNLAQQTCDLLEQNNWLTDDALIYVEVEKELNLSSPSNWQILKEKQAGQVLCRLYQRNN